MDEAFVSLTTNDEYAEGAFVLGKSLRRVNTTKRMVVLITNEVSQKYQDKLSGVWDDLILVKSLDSFDSEKLTLMKRPELGITLSKLRAWTLTQYKKCVFLDADTLVMQNVDDLFEREEISAAPDIGWPDCFNTGVFVFKPSLDTYNDLLTFAEEEGSFDGGDQGILNQYFHWWSTRSIDHHLPFTYNMVSNVCYSYAPAYKRFGSDVKIVHFLGSIKPWKHFYNTETRQVKLLKSANYSGADEKFVQLWWDCYADESITPERQVGAAAAASPVKAARREIAAGLDEEQRRKNWEEGGADYTRADSFEHIYSHVKQVISAKVDTDHVEVSAAHKSDDTQ